jgi:hypothetical protein
VINRLAAQITRISHEYGGLSADPETPATRQWILPLPAVLALLACSGATARWVFRRSGLREIFGLATFRAGVLLGFDQWPELPGLECQSLRGGPDAARRAATFESSPAGLMSA